MTARDGRTITVQAPHWPGRILLAAGKDRYGSAGRRARRTDIDCKMIPLLHDIDGCRVGSAKRGGRRGGRRGSGVAAGRRIAEIDHER